MNIFLVTLSLYEFLELICLHMVRWFQALLSNTNNPNQYLSFVCTQLNQIYQVFLCNINNLCTAQYFQMTNDNHS